MKDLLWNTLVIGPYHWNIIPPDRLFHHILNYFH